ncbi:MAG TPA: protein-L-isoaspartate(D-aspartate) O-methyltransferase [Woeseiaceae bacterium]|nr:protein-L-isoaspartate(D-aspartate) O-methyltransferase [Woeseiaceae bacterium]
MPDQLAEDDFTARRHDMVGRQLAARGVRSTRVLDAMRTVPREEFVPDNVREFAYQNSPLPIGSGQTISQPYIVAFMLEALGLSGEEKILEVGAGSGYAAAVLGQITKEVYAIERIPELAQSAAATIARLGYDNVEIRQGDGTRGWPEHAPFDAIVVAAGGRYVPDALRQQLRIGGRLVIPVGRHETFQELVRITRRDEQEFEEENLAAVRFVPLISDAGDESDASGDPPAKPEASVAQADPAAIVRAACEPFESVENANLHPLLNRLGEARVVLLGEASHGTSDFYRMRNRITRELIRQRGFRVIAIEADWPDAARIDHYVRHFEYPPSEWTAFARFPTWMWRNRDVRGFVDWLRDHNGNIPAAQRVAFHGLDLYSLYSSIRTVLEYLDDVDPQTAALARERYGCLTPWQSDPITYGRAALSEPYRTCEREVVKILMEIAKKQRQYAEHDGERFLDAVQNARLVANAERYYRTMYYGSQSSWNLRDCYMFETLQSLLQHHAPDNKTVVWAHNSHIGDAAATEMSARGELNIGHLCREAFGEDMYAIGFGTDRGTVAAASDWDGPMEVKQVRRSLDDSYEHLFHETGLAGGLLGLRAAEAPARTVLMRPRLERAIGVVYRPETERASHYFQAVLPRQFDEYVWIDETRAVEPIGTAELKGMPETYPFGV